MGKRSPKRGRSAARAPFLRGDSEGAETNEDELTPAFSFERMQDRSGHSFNCCQDDDRLYLAKRMFMLSRTSWRDIRGASRKGFGAEKIERRFIKKEIPKSVTEDVDFFYSLHYVGNKRFIGYKIKRIFYVLWIDYDYSVYNHGT